MNHQEILDNGLACANLFSQALFKRPESLSKYLPYESFIKSDKVFLLKDGSLGAVFKLNLLEHETMNAQEIINSVDSLKSWFSLPTNCTLQVLFDQSYVSSLDKMWDEMREQYLNPHPVSKILYDEKIKMFRFSENNQRPMERNAYVSIRFYPDYMNKSGHYKSLFKKGEYLLFQETKDFVKELKAFTSLLKNLEMNSKVKLERANASSLVELLRKCFNPKTFYKREFASFNESVPISDQVIYNSPVLHYSGIEREEVKSRTLSLKTAPSFAYSGGMSYFLKLDIPFTISMNFSFPTDKKINGFFNFKHMLLEKAMSESAKRQFGEIKDVQKSLAHGDRCLYMTFNIHIEASSEDELDEMERKIASIFNDDLSCEVIREDDIGLGLFLNGLPLNYTPKADLAAARFIRVLKSDAVKFVPIFDSFKGMGKAQGLYLSRENNLTPFKLPKGHTVVVADTGSGKSNFIVDCVQAAKLEEVEPLIFVIDRKSSYKMVAPNFDGDLTIFDPREDMPFSPFRGVYDEQKISFLTKLITTAVKLTSPKFDFESEHTAAINKALKYAYVDKLEKMGLAYIDGDLVNIDDEEGVEVELSMDDVVAQLAGLTALKEFEKLEEEITTLLNKLKPFYGDGLYAKFFRESSLSKKKRKQTLFYAYDLDALSTDETLQSLMTMSVIEEIRQTIKLPENESRGGYIVIEELGMFGRNNKEASSFIIDAAETFRKLGYYLIALTPRVSNYFNLEVGKAMWNLSTNYIFLQMKEDDVDFIMANSNVLDEASGPIVKSLRTVIGEYADVFYVNKTKTIKGAFRYIQTIYDRWLAPTNALEEAEAKKARKKFGQHKWQALEYLAKTFPQGISV